MKKLKELWKNKPEIILFIGSFLFLVLIGLMISYNYEIKDNYNLLFDSDTARVIKDATEIGGEHYRVSVHPLFILFVQPICFLLSGITLNKMIAIILLSSFVSSLSVVFLYKILNRIQKNQNLSLIISLIYLFSFSNIIFTAGIETYNFASLFLILLWYYFILKEKELDKTSYILLVLLGITSFAFTITNIIIFGIILLLLLINKKITLKNAILVGITVILSVFVLNIGQKLIWNNTPFFWSTNVSEETTNFGNNNISLHNIKNVIENDYSNSLISPSIGLKVKYGSTFNGQNYIISFQKMNVIGILFLVVFYALLAMVLIRNFKKNKYLNIGLLLALAFNTCLHIIYGNDGTFLYSLHFLYLIILLLGINLGKEENESIKKYGNIFLIIFLIVELINNNIIVYQTIKLIKDNIKANYLMTHLGTIPTILLEIGIIIVIGLIIYFIRKLILLNIKEKNKEKKIILITSIIGLILFIEWIFIMINAIEEQEQFLWIHFDKQIQEFTPKEKKDYMTKSFQETFKKELLELENYKKEYDELKTTYQVQTTVDPNWFDYYYFGMGNRKKYYYKANQIIEIDSKKVVKEFDEKEHYLIPNLYTVLIETKNGKFIKIMEDEDGVHFIENNKEEILEGTDVKLSLETFENQKYQNVKKVLYGELLFNIKDSIIYPNIIVYQNPWYRDAAITCMVLKQTNNTDLITDWVMNIEDIYDRQNNGVEEVDNLGELLYILSTQEKRREDLIKRIEDEAERIARLNPNGYYLYGKTDFGDQYLYQNLWYEFGLRSLGKTSSFDINSIPEDLYSKMAWWSNYSLNDKTPFETSKEYPYLSYASRHKLGEGVIVLNENLYPLSWESFASSAVYQNYQGLENGLSEVNISPLHSWSASELLLWLLDETGNLTIH